MGTIKIIMYILIIVAILYAVWLVVSSYKRTKAFFEKKIPPLTNFHTHTTYCDGECSAQEMLEAAIAQNMEAIGFSVHSHLDSEPDWTIDKNEMQLYVGELSNMQGDYEPKIRVLIGIEQDYWSREEDCDIEGIEYKIGSVHSLIEEDTTWSSVDYKPENTATCRDKYFDGDIYKMVERYFELVGDIYERTHCNIVGHFDLITKFNNLPNNEYNLFIDVNDERYINAEQKALEKLSKAPVIFEINTGGMSRGYTTAPYPSERVLQYLGEHKIPVIFASDAHTTDTLLYGRDEVLKLVEKYNLELVNYPI
ncbi:MAG: histidinol-phosphatase HisJ family protein [Oscillospiraceae bacterium]|nr:histidinol-phosphatase HisJ family protein [Candidatus Limimonas egerieequi]